MYEHEDIKKRAWRVRHTTEVNDNTGSSWTKSRTVCKGGSVGNTALVAGNILGNLFSNLRAI